MSRDIVVGGGDRELGEADVVGLDELAAGVRGNRWPPHPRRHPGDDAAPPPRHVHKLPHELRALQPAPAETMDRSVPVVLLHRGLGQARQQKNQIKKPYMHATPVGLALERAPALDVDHRTQPPAILNWLADARLISDLTENHVVVDALLEATLGVADVAVELELVVASAGVVGGGLPVPGVLAGIALLVLQLSPWQHVVVVRGDRVVVVPAAGPLDGAAPGLVISAPAWEEEEGAQAGRWTIILFLADKGEEAVDEQAPAEQGAIRIRGRQQHHQLHRPAQEVRPPLEQAHGGVA